MRSQHQESGTQAEETGEDRHDRLQARGSTVSTGLERHKSLHVNGVKVEAEVEELETGRLTRPGYPITPLFLFSSFFFRVH